MIEARPQGLWLGNSAGILLWTHRGGLPETVAWDPAMGGPAFIQKGKISLDLKLPQLLPAACPQREFAGGQSWTSSQGGSALRDQAGVGSNSWELLGPESGCG